MSTFVAPGEKNDGSAHDDVPAIEAPSVVQSTFTTLTPLAPPTPSTVAALTGFVEISPHKRYIRFDELFGKTKASNSIQRSYKAFDTKNGVEVAWHTINLNALEESEQMGVTQCCNIVKKMQQNKHIIEYLSAWFKAETRTLNVITTQLDTLKEFFGKVLTLRWRIVKKWCRQILRGLDHLHTSKPVIVHRSLSCSSIYIDSGLSATNIGDLWMAAVLSDDSTSSIGLSDNIIIDLAKASSSPFIAPELLESRPTISTKVDIYSFGMCVLEMITREKPYKECGNSFAKMGSKAKNGKLPNSFRRVTHSLASKFILECLRPEHERPTASELLQHDFLISLPEDDDEVTLGAEIIESEDKEDDFLIDEVPVEGGGVGGTKLGVKVEKKENDEREEKGANFKMPTTNTMITSTQTLATSYEATGAQESLLLPSRGDEAASPLTGELVKEHGYTSETTSNASKPAIDVAASSDFHLGSVSSSTSSSSASSNMHYPHNTSSSPTSHISPSPTDPTVVTSSTITPSANPTSVVADAASFDNCNVDKNDQDVRYTMSGLKSNENFDKISLNSEPTSSDGEQNKWGALQNRLGRELADFGHGENVHVDKGLHDGRQPADETTQEETFEKKKQPSSQSQNVQGISKEPNQTTPVSGSVHTDIGTDVSSISSSVTTELQLKLIIPAIQTKELKENKEVEFVFDILKDDHDTLANEMIEELGLTVSKVDLSTQIAALVSRATKSVAGCISNNASDNEIKFPVPNSCVDESKVSTTTSPTEKQIVSNDGGGGIINNDDGIRGVSGDTRVEIDANTLSSKSSPPPLATPPLNEDGQAMCGAGTSSTQVEVKVESQSSTNQPPLHPLDSSDDDEDATFTSTMDGKVQNPIEVASVISPQINTGLVAYGEMTTPSAQTTISPSTALEGWFTESELLSMDEVLIQKELEKLDKEARVARRAFEQRIQKHKSIQEQCEDDLLKIEQDYENKISELVKKEENAQIRKDVELEKLQTEMNLKLSAVKVGATLGP